MKKIILIIFAFIVFSNEILFSNNNLISSGPMLGYSDFFECLIWIQTTQEANVKAKYWVKGNKNKVFETKEIKTLQEYAYVAKLIADKVQPNNIYEYTILVNNKEIEFNYPLEFQTQKLWEWRTDPPNFKMAFGSCMYVNDSIYDRPGRPYGGNHEIFGHIYKEKPDFMVWLGDNIYLREPDWNTKTGIYYRYTHSRAIKELQPLLASTHNYAIWDDHDFGPNDSDRGFFNKEQTLDAFKLFWGNFNYGINGKPGITSKFTWGDVDVFLLDNRYYRTPNNRNKTVEKTILGKEQIDWLIDNLTYSKATFKIIAIGGQFLNPLQIFENYSNYYEEQQKIIELITKEKIEGVIFISGDRHFSEITKLDRESTYPLIDFTVSSLTAGPSTKGCEENNRLRIDGSCYANRNFGIFEFTGKRKERKLIYKLINYKGEEIYKKEIKENELK